MPQEIAELLGYTARWVRTVIGRWNQRGEEGIRDHRQDAAGSPMLLSQEEQEDLRAALQHPPEDGGIWSGPKVARWMGQRLGRTVAPQRGWITCSDSGTAVVCLALSMPKPMRPANRSLKKPPRAASADTAPVSTGQR